MADLYVPELDADDDTIAAALKYAAAGWYVLPIRRNARKHPGSVVGKQWQHQSNRDPEVIAAWFAGTDHGIALHLGRSGAIAFDVDYPDRVPSTLADALEIADPPFQTTRIAGDPGRGHYVFAMPTGRILGNGTGRLGGAWGEIRGRNGIIVVAPSLHDDEAAGGFYRWQQTGPVPDLPDSIADLLGDVSASEDAATDAEVAAFLAAHTGNTRPELLPGWVTTYRRRIEAGESRHDRMVTVATGAMKEAKAGFMPARMAADTLHSVFCEAVRKPPLAGSQQRAARNRGQARAEYAGILAWAVAQANAADLDEIRRRVNEKMPPGPTLLEAGEIYDWFWNARRILQHIHDFARARRCSPWAVLGVTLARACAAVPPFVVLPALVGGHVSLNTYVGLVGPSGAGKDAATAAARDAVDVGPVETAGVGSGEGIAHQFMTYKRPTKTDAGGLTQYREAVLLTAAEVDTLTALHRRQASTILPELRKAWTGSALGFAYVDKEKRLTLPEHRYRLCLIVGIQPERGGGILQDTDGGTPQRFLWMPATDPDAPDVAPAAPEPWTGWRVPRWPMATAGRVALPVCPAARDVIDAARVARLRGDGEALDGHALLCRLKVAAVLAILDGRFEIAGQDWDLAGVIAAKSEWTRQRVVRTLERKQQEANTARGKAEGERSVIVAETVEDAAIKRVARLIAHKLTGADWLTRSELRNGLANRDRGYFDPAIDRLIEAGQVEPDGAGRGVRYRHTGGTE